MGYAFAGYVRLACLMLFAFLVLYLVTGEQGKPGGTLFGLLCVYFSSLLGGALVGNVSLRLPPLLGMLIMGFLCSNLPKVDELVGLPTKNGDWSKEIRLLALTMILCRAGLGLDVEAVTRLRNVVGTLAILPSTMEACAVAVMARFFLGFNWVWAFMLGYVVAPISPAVVIPSVLALQDQGYGTTTGIPSMMVAAAALDDVLSLAGFGIFSSLAFDTTSTSAGAASHKLWLNIGKAPLAIVVGVFSGWLAGQFMGLLLPKDGEYSTTWRALWLFNLAVVLMAGLGLKQIGFEGSSSLAVLVMCVVAVRCWGPGVSKPVSASFNEVWNHLAQPLLFGLVGAGVVVSDMHLSELLISLGILAVSLSWRLLWTVAASSVHDLRWQEKVFVAVAWLPKATVQAAIGMKAHDSAVGLGMSQELIDHGHLIFTASVVAILLTAPAGAAVISAIGPTLLTKNDDGTEDGVGAPLVIPEIPSIRGVLTEYAELRTRKGSMNSHEAFGG
uniref:Cation/H+ exchanger transmembrane domain-containing protein n=1 Tax=Noctiluca scintillans TaxID=2966 RepID=A0A7S1A199_NOCSC|mmetsp:Transcript_26605/g.69871  ORF Transcript_26605/g.69871 Transcript_26605/m.69871 type:complete len:500 (+) Transcript_26605:67-1566(+)